MKSITVILAAGLTLGFLSASAEAQTPQKPRPCGPGSGGPPCPGTTSSCKGLSGGPCIAVPQDCDISSQSCPCDPAFSSCADYIGEDESGLPLLAREAEEAGAPCDVVEVDGVTRGDCGGWYSWSCQDGRCQDDLERVWLQAPDAA